MAQLSAFTTKLLSKLTVTVLIAGTFLIAHTTHAAWQESFEPLPSSEWNRDRAAHLRVER
jgi:hypothetical protein